MSAEQEPIPPTVIATQEPKVFAEVEPVAEPEPSAKELLKLKRMEQLRAARESKKAKNEGCQSQKLQYPHIFTLIIWQSFLFC